MAPRTGDDTVGRQNEALSHTRPAKPVQASLYIAPQHGRSTMDREQLMGRFVRLKHELSAAYAAQPWQSGRIDRIADDLAETERQIAASFPIDEQAGESMLPFTR